MKPVIALVGRPNVGKSTLFNRLTRSRDALVADLPGLTRDRQYGDGRVGGWPYIVVDTGGLGGEAETLDAAMAGQTLVAVREADVVVFLVDGHEGLLATDRDVAELLRREAKRVLLCVNKTDGVGEERAALEFHELGFAETVAIAAAHNRGVRQLVETVATMLGVETDADDGASARGRRDERGAADEHGAPRIARGRSQDGAGGGDAADEGEGSGPAADAPEIRIAFVGRPNVGKSTLINRLVGEERLVAFDTPGTTRDAVAVPFARGGRDYVLVDTAGVRRRGRVREAVEKFSVVKTLQAIDRANVCVVLVDAGDGLTEQDLSLLGYVVEKGRALVVAMNKWDAVDSERREALRAELERRVEFLRFTRVHFISAKLGSGVGDLFRSIDRAHASAFADLATSRLTRLLESAVTAHAPPMIGGRRIKLRYAHQGGRNPPLIVVHGNQASRLPASYRRYLVNHFRRALGLFGTPLRVEPREGENPFATRDAATRRGGGRARAKAPRSEGRGGGTRKGAGTGRR